MPTYDLNTRAGFQAAMKDALSTRTPAETQAYAEATATPSFVHTMNGKKYTYDEWIAGLEAWSGKITDYEPLVEEFLRDGDKLAARMTGVLQLDGVETFYESFFFGRVDAGSGRLVSLIERAVWGAVGE